MGDKIMDWLTGVSNFFNWLLSTITGIWNTFSLVVIFIIFIAIQVGFIYLYIRLIIWVLRLYPQLKYITRRIDEWAKV